ncbi:hypothetical protein Q8F55_007177 [Vanrija albida]|uniref:Beta-lactamase-related domain-containing protein n=1 Tax=Vanrija albida TaxID=181172 RepID=A0ABR3PZC3_9TREE
MSVKLSDKATQQIDQLLADYPQADYPGTVIGAINKAGELLYLKATGLKNIDTKEKYETDTLFWVASFSKLVTAVGAMQLVEQGKIGLDDPVGKVLPELANPEVIVSTTPEETKTRPAKVPITYRMLLSHTSGLGYPFWNQDILHWAGQAGQASWFTNVKHPLVFEPGTSWEYSVGLDWMAVAMERITGLTLDEYSKEYIFDPLGMVDSTFNLASRPDLQPRLATLHTWDAASGKTSTMEFAHNPLGVSGKEQQSGGAGLHSTPTDYLRLLQVLLNDGENEKGVHILKTETVKTMFEDQLANIENKGALGDSAPPTTMPAFAHTPLVIAPGLAKGWGLSFLLNKDDWPGNRKSHTAEWAGIACLSWVADPKSEVAFVIFNEIIPYCQPKFIETMTKLQGIIYADGALVK